MEKVKRALKWIGGIAAVLLVMFLLLMGIFTYNTKYKIGDIDASTSPDGKYEVLFQSVGEPDWPFGYSHARLVLRDKERTITKYGMDVANDGATLWPDNWKVSWEEDAVRVTISGEEQWDILYTLYYDGRYESTPIDPYTVKQ